LPINAFGLDASKDDQRNFYCRECVRRKMREWRAAVKLGRQSPATRPAHRLIRRPAPFVMPAGEEPALDRFVPLVLGALADGARAQGEIVEFAHQRMPRRVQRRIVEDQVTLAIGELFQRRAIATRGEADARVYFRREFVRRWRW
jgi:hypothetical protein